MLEIAHSHAEGTIIHGTARGDGSAEVLKSQRWRWGRSIGAWYVPYSRDQLAKAYLIDETVKALEAAGFEVSVSIEDGHRSTAEVEADLAERRQDRADALTAKADRKSDAADEAWTRADRTRDALPEGGEPIKIGHHSERRHRRAVEKAWSTLGAAVAAEHEKDEAHRRADVASRGTQHRYSPVTVANRIKKLDAEVRAHHRRLDGHVRTLFTDAAGRKHTEEIAPATGAYRERIEAELAQLLDELGYWQGIRAEQIARGETPGHGPDSIAKGDLVAIRGDRWYKVTRVNPKSVTVGFEVGGSFRVEYHEIRGHKPAAS